MIINTNKQDNENAPITPDSINDQLKQIQIEIDKLCQELAQESMQFNEWDFFKKLCSYISTYERLLYTNITNYVCTLSEKQFATVQSNIDAVAHYIYSIDFEKEASNLSDKKLVNTAKKTVLKLWDHINLARRQYQLFLATDEKYSEIAEEKVKNIIPGLTKDMNSQLIALVSIFTALSFLLFGGISSLDNILDGARDIPVLKLLIVGNIWCFCIMNLIFVFMFFISKLTKLNIKSTDDINANFIQKYPFIWWCNWFLISSGLSFAWIYYLKTTHLLIKIEGFLFKNSTLFVILTTIFLLLLILVSGIYILLNNGKTKISRHKY